MTPPHSVACWTMLRQESSASMAFMMTWHPSPVGIPPWMLTAMPRVMARVTCRARAMLAAAVSRKRSLERAPRGGHGNSHRPGHGEHRSRASSHRTISKTIMRMMMTKTTRSPSHHCHPHCLPVTPVRIVHLHHPHVSLVLHLLCSPVRHELQNRTPELKLTSWLTPRTTLPVILQMTPHQ